MGRKETNQDEPCTNHYILTSADFFKINFFEKFFQNTIRVSSSLDQVQAQRYVGPDLGPNCLQRLSEDDTSRQGFN